MKTETAGWDEGPQNGYANEQRSARLESVGQDREWGAVTAEMNRLGEVGLRLEKVAATLRGALEGILVDRPSPGLAADGASPSPSRCDLAATIAGHVDNLGHVAARLEDLRQSIDL